MRMPISNGCMTDRQILGRSRTAVPTLKAGHWWEVPGGLSRGDVFDTAVLEQMATLVVYSSGGEGEF